MSHQQTFRGGRIAACSIGFVALLAAPAHAQVGDDGFDWVTVGDVGNPVYELPPHGYNPVVEGRGSVGYAYRITRSEISTGEYFEFFSRFCATSDALEYTLNPGSTGLRRNPYYFGPGEEYHLDPADPHAARRPISVSRNAAMMYCNWLHNGRTSDPADLLHGAYDFNGAPGGVPVSAEPGARYRMPTLDEYMKAVYYDPDKNGQGPGWWRHANQSDEPSEPGSPDAAAHPYGLSDAELLDLFGETNTSHLPLGLYDGPQSQSHYGLIDVLTGRGEVLGDLEFVYEEDWLNELYGRQAIAFPSAWGVQFPLEAQGMSGGDSDFRAYSFRLVMIVPGPPSAVLIGLGFTAMLRRGRRDMRNSFLVGCSQMAR